MADKHRIRHALEAAISHFGKNPQDAFSTDRTTAHLDTGYLCMVEQADNTVSVDMPQVLGGGGSAPSPGFYGRAAIASCVAMGIRSQAELAGVPVASVDVAIEMDWDDRGLLAMENRPAGSLGVRMTINIDSPGDPDEVRSLASRAMNASPWFSTLVGEHQVDTTVIIRA